jgi:hypothetical protein
MQLKSEFVNKACMGADEELLPGPRDCAVTAFLSMENCIDRGYSVANLG